LKRKRQHQREIIIGAMAVAALAGGAWSVQAEFGPDDGGPALHEGCGERGNKWGLGLQSCKLGTSGVRIAKLQT